MANKRKRRLSPEEIVEIRNWMENAPQGRKPSIRQIAKALGVTRPSVIKSLKGWKGIQRNRPEKPPKPKLIETDLKPSIEPFTTKLE